MHKTRSVVAVVRGLSRRNHPTQTLARHHTHERGTREGRRSLASRARPHPPPSTRQMLTNRGHAELHNFVRVETGRDANSGLRVPRVERPIRGGETHEHRVDLVLNGTSLFDSAPARRRLFIEKNVRSAAGSTENIARITNARGPGSCAASEKTTT